MIFFRGLNCLSNYHVYKYLVYNGLSCLRFTCVDPEGGGRGWGWDPPPPSLKILKNIGFLSNTGADPLK